jgi:hypothetical protein
MSTNPPVNVDKIEELLATGNIGQFNNLEKVAYINKICDMMGLNPLTRPFDYISFQGKVVLYARKDCTDQLRKIHGVSIRITNQAVLDGLLTVTVEATDKTGRVDSDMGALNIAGLKGEALGNATMKAVTKAKRRVTLSICGLGILDESEIENSQTPFMPQGSIEVPTDKTFENIRALLDAKNKSDGKNRTEKDLLDRLSSQSGGEVIAKLEDLNSAQIEVAYRILGGSK